jgi:hypothetical protein
MEDSLRPQPFIAQFLEAATQAGRAGSRQLTFRPADFERPADEVCWLSDSLTLTHRRDIFPIDSIGTNWEQCSSYVPIQEAGMLKTFVEEAAALASITLFIGMIAVWAQLIPQI